MKNYFSLGGIFKGRQKNTFIVISFRNISAQQHETFVSPTPIFDGVLYGKEFKILKC